MSNRIKGFAPIVFDDSEVLLLGTLPGVLSLERGFYFADEGNYFWEFFCEYADCEKPQNMDDAILILKKVKVALWDVYESATREDKNAKETSSDSDISQVVWNDLQTFLKVHPNIKRIGVMGKKAYQDIIKQYPDISVECLPSTSGSNGGQWGGKPIDRSSIGWKKFSEFIGIHSTPNRYNVITLCGSTRFKNEFLETQKRLTLEGNIVISVGLFGHAGDNEVWENMDEGTLTKTKEMLDDMHKAKIDMADEIFVINVGGYIGESTRSEIEYAKKCGKRIRYLEP